MQTNYDIESGPLLKHIDHPPAIARGFYHGHEVQDVTLLARQENSCDCKTMFGVIFVIASILSFGAIVASFIIMSQSITGKISLNVWIGLFGGGAAGLGICGSLAGRMLKEKC